MIIHRNNPNANGSTTEERLASMQRHHERGKEAAAHGAGPPARPAAAAPPGDGGGPGDIIYGAAAAALFIFGTPANALEATRNRRRVYGLWAYYRDRAEKAGFFKLKGALCLSKSQWRMFHGL